MDWSDGYMTEVEYSYGYFSHVNPMQIRFLMLNAGLMPPKIETACELGFGHGVTLNVHAAASAVNWYGNDFHPAHCAFANLLREASGDEAKLSDESFAEYCVRGDLPDFDFIAMHGVWSWISDANRTVIIDFIRRKLKPGGILSISYNTLQRWSAASPLRDLLLVHASRMSAPGLDMVPRIDAAINFADRVLQCVKSDGPVQKALINQLKDIKRKDRVYLAGEYFGDEWHPMSFARVSRWMEAAKLSFACTAKPKQHVLPIVLTREQEALLNSIPDQLARETVFDQLVNQGFRCDYWGKGLLPLSLEQRREALLSQRVVLVRAAAGLKQNAKFANGEVYIEEAVFARVLDALDDHQPHTLRQIEGVIQPHGINLDRLLEVLLLLMNRGRIYLAQDDGAVALARPKAIKLNRALMEYSAAGIEISTLASAVTGCGIGVSRYHQLFLSARDKKCADPIDWAEFALRRLEEIGEVVARPANAIHDPAENLDELIVLAKAQGKKDPEGWARATLQFLLKNDRRIVKTAPALNSRQEQLDELILQACEFKKQTLSGLLALGIA